MRSSGRAFGIDPDRIVGAGDSAGGQMTVGLALVLRDHGAPQLRGQVLIYPVLGADVNTPSYIRNAHAPCLTKPEMIFYLDCFLGPKGNPNWFDPGPFPIWPMSRKACRPPTSPWPPMTRCMMTA